MHKKQTLPLHQRAPSAKPVIVVPLFMKHCRTRAAQETYQTTYRPAENEDYPNCKIRHSFELRPGEWIRHCWLQVVRPYDGSIGCSSGGPRNRFVLVQHEADAGQATQEEVLEWGSNNSITPSPLSSFINHRLH